MPDLFVDSHCHLLPSIDDGAADPAESLAMAMLAVDEGFGTVIVTPHQLGAFAKNQGDAIRFRCVELQELFKAHDIPLCVLPGAEVRVDDGMIEKLIQGDALTLGDHRKHVLLELPHELYMPLDPVLDQLERRGMVGVLAHPERNQGILQQPSLVEMLVQRGCLMQVTASSLTGAFGPASQAIAEQMCRRGMVHLLATDAHGPKVRRPKMKEAYRRAIELAGVSAADKWCRENPRLVAEGADVPAGVVAISPERRSGWKFWKKAG